MEKEPNRTGQKQVKEDGRKRTQFKKGVSGNPAGRPKGSISIKDEIRRHLKKHPEEFKKLCQFYLQDKKMRELLWKMIDGLPRQSIELGVDEKIGEVKIEIIKSKEDDKVPEEKPVP